MQKPLLRKMFGVAIFLLAGTSAPAQTGGWTGFYAGPDIGAVNARLRVSGTDAIFQLTNLRVGPNNTGTLFIVPGTSRSFGDSERHTSLLYGGFVGFQWQRGIAVFGAEADLHGGRDAASFVADFDVPATRLAAASSVTIAREAHVRYDWSARLRVGIAAGPATLLYGTGGLAQTRLRLVGEDRFQSPAGAAAPSLDPNEPPFQSPAIGPVVVHAAQQATMTGWTAGIGAEHRISRHLGVGLDARYTDYGSHTFRLAQGCNPFAVATNGCGGATLSAAPFVIPGRGTATYTDPNFALPGAIPDETQVRLSEWRIAARLLWRF